VDIMSSRRKAIVSVVAAAAIVLVEVAVLSPPAHAFNTITVDVTVNSASVFHGCWDDFCGRPDLFVTFYGTGTGSQSPACKSAAVPDHNIVGNPPPSDWTCHFNVSRPGTLYIGLYDGDGPNQDNTRGQQIDVSPGPEASATVDLENIARSPGAPVTLTSQGDDATISYTVSAVINPGELKTFTVDKNTFQPSVGEQITVTAAATGAPYTFLRIHGYNSSGVEVWNIFGYLDNPGQTEKTFIWQGRDPFGNPLPPGDYTLKLQGFDTTSGQPAFVRLPDGTKNIGGQLETKVTIQPPPPVASLAIASINPSPWAPTVGDLTVGVVSSGTTVATGEVFSSGSCGGPKLADLGSVTLQPLRPGILTWNGAVTTGATVSPATVGIRITGTSAGSPTSPATVCKSLTVTTAPQVALIYFRHAPFLPDPGKTVEITANAVDASGAPRIVGRLAVWGSVQAVPGSTPTAPTSPLKTCAMASTCTATVTLPPGGSFLSWQATAQDRGPATIATSGWRGQRIIDGQSYANATLLAIPVDEALNGPAMADARDDAKSLDLLFAVSTDFNWTSATDRTTIGDALDLFTRRLWGISGAGTPALTTFAARPDLVRIFVTPERPLVSWTPAGGLCNWTAPAAAWADATAVLHKTDCRDNAYPSTHSFSAKLLAPDVIFHELHHALFGLEDEYCCNGGYGENQPNPNIYNTLAGCLADPLFKPGGCQPIAETDILTGMPTGRTFFRLDAEPSDVMIDNSTQRAADIRRANAKEQQCDIGRC
jgi:hypothetical protein